MMGQDGSIYHQGFYGEALYHFLSGLPHEFQNPTTYPIGFIGSMYGIYANIWGILMVNLTIYTIHGSYGYCTHFAGLFSQLRRGVKRFIADVQKMEKRFGTKILCPERLKMLDRKANYWSAHRQPMNLGRQLFLRTKMLPDVYKRWLMGKHARRTHNPQHQYSGNVWYRVLAITLELTVWLLKIRLCMIYLCFAPPPWSWNTVLPSPIR